MRLFSTNFTLSDSIWSRHSRRQNAWTLSVWYRNWHICPCGRREDNRDFLGVYLSCETRQEHQVFLSITAVSSSGDRLCMGAYHTFLLTPIGMTVEGGSAVFTESQHVWGFSQFLHHKLAHNRQTGYYQDNVLQLVATIKIQDSWRELMTDFEQRCSVQRPIPQDSVSTAAECVICLSAPQTSGFVHGEL